MNTFEIVLIVTSAATVAGAAILSQLLHVARAEARYWRRAARANNDALADALDEYHELRMNSHRRDPKTGRLLPKGE